MSRTAYVHLASGVFGHTTRSNGRARWIVREWLAACSADEVVEREERELEPAAPCDEAGEGITTPIPRRTQP
jgi:hypothetical protein